MADGVAITAGSGTTILTDDTGAGGHAQVVKLAISTDGSGTLIPADTANGIDVDVTRLPALAAGTNNIGDVDVLSLPGSLTGYAEDVGHNTGDVGVMALAVRRDSETSSSGTAGDYTPLHVDANGRLYVQQSSYVRSSATPTIGAALYAAGDFFGTVMTFSSAAIANGGAGRVVNATLTNRDTELPLLELWLFRASPTMVNTDNGVFDITDANLETADLIGVIEFTTYYATASGNVSQGSYRGASLGAAPLHYVCGASATAIDGALCVRNGVTPASTSDVIVTLTLERL